MKSSINFERGSRGAWSSFTRPIRSLVICTMVLAGIMPSANAQDVNYTKPSLWLGGAVGANINFYRGTTHELSSDFTTPTAFHNGSGLGLYLAPLLEYYKPDSRLGFMLQIGYDSRKGSFDQVTTPCNCPADLSAVLTYLTIEPSLRFAPFKSDFYLYGGPRFAFNFGKSFEYEQGVNPAFPDQIAVEDISGDFSNVFGSMITLQIGAGYDIELNSQDKQKQAVLSPFISIHPYFNQDPRSIETWNVTTLRVGAALKFGKGKKVTAPVKVAPAALVLPLTEVKFSVDLPGNITAQRRVRETFPLRNYVFFDLNSVIIPDRYVLLTKDQVKDFKEDQLEAFMPKKLSGRSDRQMIVYYNVLNILGDRMIKYPAANVRLTGASREGNDDGLAMAESVKQYLTGVFGIDPSRIKTEGRTKPRIESELPGATKELGLIREDDRRVSVWSESAELLMEFQSESDAPLRPVEIVGVQQSLPNSYVTFIADGAKETFTSWTLEIRDEKGTLQKFGPYKQDKVSIPGKTILGSRPSGDYRATMVGKRKAGKTVKKEVPVHMVLRKPDEYEEAMRYSIIFEINESNAIYVYEKYLTDIVTPKIPIDGMVTVHGHTDVVGDADHNQELSMDRAVEVTDIIKSALSKAGRSDVKFEVLGFGEDEFFAPFDNNYPEERFYNRAVIIDIMPPAKE